MKEVDWDKAPEGTTHYNAYCINPWLRNEGSRLYFWVKDLGWEKYTCTVMSGTHLSSAIPKPTGENAVKRPEWDGIGVPPVGTVCEYRLNDGPWFKCEITYTLSGADDCFVAWCDHLSIEQFLTFSSKRYTLQLRKIKTPEQIAVEERQQAIDEMASHMELYDTFKDVMGKLYDAGYRKTEV